MLKWFKNLSIKLKLVISFIFILLLSFLSIGITNSILMYNTVDNMMKNNLMNVMNNVYTISKTAVTTSVKSNLNTIVETNKQIAEYYYNLYIKGELSEEEAKNKIAEIFLNQNIGNKGYIFVLDASNAPKKVTFAVHPELEQYKNYDISKIPYIKKSINEREGYFEYKWAENSSDEKMKEKAIFITYFEPWKWVICASAMKSEFTELIDTSIFREDILSTKIGKSGYPYIVDIEGNIILHPEIENENVYDLELESTISLLEKAKKEKNGTIRYLLKDDDSNQSKWKLAYFRYLEDIDWVIVSTVYEDEIYSPLNYQINMTIFMLILTLLLILPLVILIVKNILNPLVILMQDVKKIREGNFNIKSRVKSNDEIGMLANEFDNMTDKLNESFDKIEKQNKEIKKSNENLELSIKQKTENLANALIDMKKSKDRADEAYQKLKTRNEELIDLNSKLIIMDEKNEKLQTLIRQYTPKATWSHVLETLDNEGLEESIEEITTTMLFADIKNFTKFAERYTPKIVLQSLNEIFAMVSNVIYKYNGDIDKFIGDAFFAVFNNPQECINASLEISRRLDKINDNNMMSGKPPLFLRFGINTGEVVRGNIGSEIRRDNTLIGDAVNITQRLESESIPGQILISKSTYSGVKDKIKVSEEIELSVKGRKQKIKAYYVENIISNSVTAN
ncbi:MAG: cache domain-containing protein [Spirochaetota bacterium]